MRTAMWFVPSEDDHASLSGRYCTASGSRHVCFVLLAVWFVPLSLRRRLHRIMSTPAGIAESSLATQIYVARQPIFDVENRRVAYELLYRATPEATSAGAISDDTMCSDTALHSVVSIGLDRLTAGVRAFVNITRDHLVGELHRVFDPSTVVLELLESIDGEPAVIDACRRAVADGYTLALDDYDGRASLDVLLPFVHIIKLDVLDRDLTALAPQVTALLARGLTVLAERVETNHVRTQCVNMGCTLFQGYVYSRPETIAGRSLSVEQMTMFNVIALLRDPDVEDLVLAEAFRSHPSLTFALLRIVNSASFGGRAVSSIDHAIRLVGRESLSRWLLVMLVASSSQGDPVASETVVQALVRARFCELMSDAMGTGDASTRFLVGLLSRMDVMLGIPIAQLLERLPVSADVRDALLDGTGPHATLLALAVAYEAADWATVASCIAALRSADAVPVTPRYSELYATAVTWARERLGRVASN